MDLSEQLVEALQAVSGAHAGFRAAHARGICAEGSFRATPDAAGLSRAAHLLGDEVPVVVRFSNGSGDPHTADAARDGRGMAVRFRLADGASTDMVGLTMPMFFVRTPDDFLGFLAARRPDPATGAPDPAAILAWVQEHPETLPAIEFALSAPATASYLSCRYYGVHTFILEDATGRQQPFRYHWEPDGGVTNISDDDATARTDRYLTDELIERLASGPAGFTLWWTLPDPGDPLDDPTVVWPDGRNQLVAGRLELTGLVADQSAGCDRLIFDPTRVIDGVACSADPILPARSGAYGVSYSRRAPT